MLPFFVNVGAKRFQNMVGPGEVDHLLQEETTRECEKYGVVLRCEVWEARRPGTHPDETVKIYVKFRSQDQALKGTSWFVLC